MTYRGAIKNGVVVFHAPVPLEEGTVVEVRVHEEENADELEPGSPEALRRIRDLRWAGDPEELRRLTETVQEERNRDLIPLDGDNPLK